MFLFVLVFCLLGLPGLTAVQAAGDYYTEPQVYADLSNPGRDYEAFPVGVTGLEACIKKGEPASSCWRVRPLMSPNSTMISTVSASFLTRATTST